MARNRFIDTGSLIVAAVTLLFFVTALFAKGLTHDLFLEAGVFLVSVKIILMAHRNGVATRDLNQKLDKVLASLTTLDNARSDPRDLDATSSRERN
jgi:hypothetical protein